MYFMRLFGKKITIFVMAIFRHFIAYCIFDIHSEPEFQGNSGLFLFIFM